MKIFVFAAALRKGSHNKKLASRAADILRKKDQKVDYADFREFEMPVYDGDCETEKGVPENAQKLAARIAQADALLISTPEYNGGIPGALKNAIDWVSRVKPIAFDGKPLLLLSASPGGLGGIRSLWHTRVPLEAIGTLVYPEMFALSRAHEAFQEDGTFKEATQQTRLEELVTDYLSYALRVTTAPPSG